ncbi:MAG: TM2 domain-containing protein [Oscillospiraceae bacterium]|nr:TM2 domain-containing protein [Oscillospiraceae bacterium]
MTQDRVDMFIMANQKYFPPEKVVFIRERLMQMDESRFMYFSAVEYKDPTMLLIISLFLGAFGIDRFLLGDTGLGIAKLLTGGGCGIWTIVDWFTVQKKTREYNFNLIASNL